MVGSGEDSAGTGEPGIEAHVWVAAPALTTGKSDVARVLHEHPGSV